MDNSAVRPHRRSGRAAGGKKASPPKQRSDFKQTLRAALIAFALLFLLKLGIERTTLGHQIRLTAYALLQSRLVADHVDVTIVDISDLEPQQFTLNGQATLITPREPILRMIEAVLSQRPTAVGVDIDFSPDNQGYVHPDDPQFFERCLELSRRTGTALYLGIGRTVGGTQSEWLGSARFAPLAAGIRIPRDSARMIRNVSVPGGNSPSMSTALAAAHARGLQQSDATGSIQRHLLATGMVELVTENQLARQLTVQDFLVDFSSLEAIDPIRTTNPIVLSDTSLRSRLEGKVVLLGDAALDRGVDTFVIPGSQQPVPGVFLHASAVQTLLDSPLYELQGLGRTLIDLLFFLIVLVPVLVIRFRYRRIESAERFQRSLAWSVIIVGLVVGVWSVRATRIMWDDFVLVLAAVAFDPVFERRLESGEGWLRAKLLRPKKVSS